MELGFGVPVSGSWARPDDILTVAALAEGLGYRTLWTFSRVLSPVDGAGEPVLPPAYHSVLDPLAVLAYLAGRTTTIRLGVAVVNAPFVAPAVLAKTLTTIDVLSNGRLEVGLGSGWAPEEFAAAGVPMAERGARMDDYLAALHAIWVAPPNGAGSGPPGSGPSAGAVVSYAGAHYSVPRSLIAPAPVQRPHPPLLLGGMAEAALRRAGRLADGWISSSREDLSSIERSIGIVRSAAVDAGRDPSAVRIVCRGVVIIGDRRGPLTGSHEQIRADLTELDERGVDETFLDLNFDPSIGNPSVAPLDAMARALDTLEALAPPA